MSHALLPLSWVYGAGVALDRRARMVAKLPSDAHPHVISVGNLEAGGNGKTPLAMWILARAVQQGKKSAYVSRGYGGAGISSGAVICVLAETVSPPSLAGLRVMTRTSDALAHAVGDEGALVCDRVPLVSAFFCTDKVRAVQAATACGAELIVLDDAFQSWRVPRHTDVVLLDSERPLDGGQLLPAGRLRERPDALARADAIVFNGAGTASTMAAARAQCAHWLRPGLPIAGMARRIDLKAVAGDSSRPPLFLAVSSIARPQAFEQSLRVAEVQIAEHSIFPDHHRYRVRDIETLTQRALAARVSAIVTTEKDWVKLRHFAMPLPVWVARLDVSVIGDELPG